MVPSQRRSALIVTSWSKTDFAGNSSSNNWQYPVFNEPDSISKQHGSKAFDFILIFA